MELTVQRQGGIRVHETLTFELDLRGIGDPLKTLLERCLLRQEEGGII